MLASDLHSGIFLVEDLGDAVFGQRIAKGAHLEMLYVHAVDGLLAVRASKPPRDLPLPGAAAYRVPDYGRQALEVELDLLLQWYFKLETGEPASPRLSASFFEAWSPFLDWLETQPKDLVLRDYHSPNLLWCEGRDGLANSASSTSRTRFGASSLRPRVALARRAAGSIGKVGARAVRALLQRRRQGRASFDRDAFTMAYAILGAQRNTKIAGIFARLSMRDGKHGYLAHLPRIFRYLFRDLAHPGLKPLNAWYEAHLRPLADVRLEQGALT